MKIVILLAVLSSTIAYDKWIGLSFDSKQFMCEHFDPLCDNILDHIGCDNFVGARTKIGCPNYPESFNNVSHWVGKCSCSSPFTYNYPGARITTELLGNRIAPDMKWIMEPWNTGPPYDIELSYTIICNKLLDRIRCPQESQTVLATDTSFKCSCGTLNADSYVHGAMIDKMNAAPLAVMPIFSNPVYLSIPISIAMIMILGKLGAAIALYLKLPSIIGFMLVGFAIENILNPMFLKGPGYPYPAPASELKNLALVIILMRAGLALKLDEIRQYSLGTFFLSTLPYFGEFFCFMYIGTAVLGFSVIDMGLFASIMAPLSPSIVISSLLTLVAKSDKNYGYTPKMTLIAAPIEVVISIIMFGIFSLLERTTPPALYPWVKVYPLYANCLLIPLTLLFSAAMGVVLGWIVSLYINYRVTIKSDYLWTRISKNPQMGSSTADLVYVLLIACYTIYNLCTLEYIQQSSGVLVVFVCCITVSRLTDPKVCIDLAESLKGIWVFAEVMLFTLTGTSISFDSTNGPLYGQRGLDGPTIAKIFSLMLAGTAGRLVALGIFVGILAPTLPAHRQKLTWLVPFWFNIWIYQLPKATVQAALGSVAFNTQLIPGADGLNRALLISQSTAFTILIFAPLGSFLFPYVGAPISLYLEGLDKAAGWNSSKNTMSARIGGPNALSPDDGPALELVDLDKKVSKYESDEEEDDEENRLAQKLHEPDTIMDTIMRVRNATIGSHPHHDDHEAPTLLDIARNMSQGNSKGVSKAPSQTTSRRSSKQHDIEGAVDNRYTATAGADHDHDDVIRRAAEVLRVTSSDNLIPANENSHHEL